MTTSATKPLRIGILGAANIARAFIKAVAPSELVSIVAVASRDAAKGKAFAEETGVPRSHGSYEALLADPEIEAIYNPLPNGLHAEWSIKAVEAGKHVLCEKPLSVTGDEAKAMFAAAEKAGVHLVEAYPYMAQPQTLKLRELLAAKSIGPLRVIQSSFGFNIKNALAARPGIPNVRLDPTIGGGAYLDVGSYAVSLVLIAAGERPSRVLGIGRWDEQGIDRTMTATLEFPSGIIGQAACSFETALHRHAMILGEDGYIETTYLNHPPEGGAPEVKIKRGSTLANPVETIPVPGGNGFFYEAESFAHLVRGTGPWTGATPIESVDIMLTLEAIVRSAKSGVWETVGS